MTYGVDWVCECGWANLDVRKHCRKCGVPRSLSEVPALEALAGRQVYSAMLTATPPAPQAAEGATLVDQMPDEFFDEDHPDENPTVIDTDDLIEPASGKVEAEAGEPVAWRCMGDQWRYYEEHGLAHVHELHGCVIAEPLYSEATVAAMQAENERLRKAMTLAHALMRECGWQLAPAAEPQGDGVLELACAEVEETFRALLKGETE